MLLAHQVTHGITWKNCEEPGHKFLKFQGGKASSDGFALANLSSKP